MSEANENKEVSKAMQICLEHLRAGRTKKWIGEQLVRGVNAAGEPMPYSRTAISLYMDGKYGEVRKLEAAILRRFERRICPYDGEEKAPAQCVSVALRPRPHGFPDAETLWLACQTCPNKPERSAK